MEALTMMAQVSYQASARVVVAAGVGAVVDGTIADGDISPGVAASGSATLLAVVETERRPFVLVGVSLAGSRARAVSVSTDGEEQALTAFDVRLGVAVGKTFAGGWLRPYAAARGFGGPVRWTLDGEEQTGTDAHHFTIGAGAVVRAGRRFEVSAEGMALGERSVTAAVTVAL